MPTFRAGNFKLLQVFEGARFFSSIIIMKKEFAY